MPGTPTAYTHAEVGRFHLLTVLDQPLDTANRIPTMAGAKHINLYIHTEYVRKETLYFSSI